MKTFSFLNKTFVVLLCTVLAFVCVARPLQARADSSSMDYVETDMSTSDVKALFTGASAIVPAAIMIIGFIVMCYCVLRNVEVPLQFDSQTSFNDKLTQLGQYAIDNATDDLKNFLYSVYTYCDDNGITSVLGLSKFLVTKAGLFFNSITKWIGGSLIQNPTDVGQGLIENLSTLAFSPLAVFNNTYSIAPYIGDSFDFASSFFVAYRVSNYNYISCYSFIPNVNYNGLYLALTPTGGYFYSLSGSVLTKIHTFNFDNYYANWDASSIDDLPSSVLTFRHDTSYFISYNNTNGSFYFALDFLTNLIYQCGIHGVNLISLPSAAESFSVDQAAPIIIPDILNPAVDNVYVPTDVWNIDIVGTWEQIARDVSATYDQTERIAAFVGDIPLTLTSAQSYAPTINDAGNYVFPDFGSVWKYPQYFFDTLSGWGMFLGNCLRAVTVDEGGLSWIFYGGFVLLVCGGIIGKILMG